MNREEQARILRKQRAGFAALERFEIEEARRVTFADRLAAFRRIMQFARHIPHADRFRESEEVALRWRKIKTGKGSCR